MQVIKNNTSWRRDSATDVFTEPHLDTVACSCFSAAEISSGRQWPVVSCSHYQASSSSS